MAGECEEPSSISFQADLLHSGSISFGRFEKEDLSWERRSSFSHNRYLDEVEKCSRPGSVIEKKAYFEAHFKKKGMLLPGAFDGQSSGGYPTTEHDNFENVDNGEEVDSRNESSNYAYYDEDAHYDFNDEKFHYDDEIGNFDCAYADTHHAQCGDNPEGSESYEEHEVMEGGNEDPGILSSESPVEATPDHSNLLKGANEAVISEEAHGSESRSDELHHYEDREEKETEQGLFDSTTNEDESSTPIGASPKTETTKEVDNEANAVQHQNPPKMRGTKERKSVKPTLTSRTHHSQVRKGSNGDGSKGLAKNLSRRQRESPQTIKPEKHSPQASTPSIQWLHRTPKDEFYDQDYESSISSLHQRNESEKEPRTKKVAEIRHSGPKKVEPKSHNSANRFRQGGTPTRPDRRPNAAIFSFKSDKRAERRKEFNMQLEEKWHAKEAEMNQIQAKTQEKTEAEIKQFRRSLNFKATPMPSFYHVAAPRGSNGNKAVISKNGPAKVHQKATVPASGSVFNSQLPSKTRNAQALTSGGHVKSPDPSESCETIDFPTAELSDGRQTPTTCNNHPEGARENGVTGKDQEKVRRTKMHKHRVLSDGSKVHEDHMVKSKTKVRSRKSSSEMMSRSMKGSGISRTSGMGHLAVGVAS